jgi:hypothetical protein
MPNLHGRFSNRHAPKAPGAMRKYTKISSASKVRDLPRLIADAIFEAHNAEAQGEVLNESGRRPSHHGINRSK